MASAGSGAKAFLIDGTAFCYRAFYAIRSLSTSDGRPTNAVYGFAMMLQALRDRERPDYLAVAFDVGKPTFRHEKFEAYKIQRKPMPDALIGQLPVVKRLLAAYRIPVFEQEGYEAEDVLATMATRIAGQSVQVFLVTGDKDALQLVNAQTKVYNPHHNDKDPVLDAEAVRARYGVGPDRMVDLMALMGDQIDNIPGVPGIGEKTAVQLLQQFGSLQQLYDRLEELDSPSRRTALTASRAQVELSRELARIQTDVPLEVTLEALAVREPDWRALRALFRELEFKRLLKQVDVDAPAIPIERPEAALVSSPQEWDRFLARLRAVSSPPEADPCPPSMSRGRRAPLAEVAVQAWPVGTPLVATVVALAASEDDVWVIWLDAETVGSAAGQRFAHWVSDPAAHKLCHDAKAVKKLLARLGLVLNGIAGDTMVAAHLLNPARTNQTLTDLSDEYLEVRVGEPLAVEAANGLTAATLRGAFAHAACAVIRLHALLIQQLAAHQLESLYTQLELPLIDVLAQMETDGVAIDVPYLHGLRASMDTKLAQLTEEVYRLAGGSFNLNSPKQLSRVLFDQLKLPIIKRTKTGPSTDSDVLRRLVDHHPLPARLMEYRELSKLVSTYVDALPKLVDPATGRIHASFHQTATATGRLSASDPNLQHIPIKTEVGRQIRKAFIPGEQGWRLVAADYSQIELRVLAHLAGDAQLTQAFREDRDIHRYTASLIYSVPEPDVTPEMRAAMKAINYGIIYGMSAHGLSKELGMSYEEAAAFIEAYFTRYHGVRAYLDAQVQRAKQDGYVQTLLGRRRYIPELASPDLATRQFGERMAVNAPIQGTAADLIKQAMIRIAALLRERHMASRMILQVHDELVFECAPQEQDALVHAVRDVMEHAIALTVPLRVVVKSGPNWLEMTAI